MTFLNILILAVVQGICELLPVSSSAHVIMAEKLLGLDPTSPEMTLLLVMLHTGTMFAVIVYFWKMWKERYFSSASAFSSFSKQVVVATVLTGALGLTIKWFIEHVVLKGTAGAEIEQLFGNAYVIAASLATVGVMIILSGKRTPPAEERSLERKDAVWIGLVQGLCLPFRGFSRSGATISTGLFLGLDAVRAEEFSFALAVVLTPAVIIKELHRLLKAHAGAIASSQDLFHMLTPSLIGMGMSFLAGLVALKWLSRWLEQRHWHYFGYYCLFASGATLTLNQVIR